MTDQVYLQKINGNPGFVDGATIPPFASKAALDASGSGWEVGTIANAAGVPYSWSGSAWVATAGGGLTPYSDYATLSAQAPTVGKIAQIPRLCGNGYFALRGNGTRWEVCPGESIIRDTGGVGISSGYAYTAGSTGLVQLASYTIPAGLIGDGEVWGFTVSARNTGVYASGADTCQIRIASLAATTLAVATAANRVGRSEANYTRRSAGLISNSSTSSPFATNTAPYDLGVDMGIAQIISVNAAAGAITNTMNISEFGVYRKL